MNLIYFWHNTGEFLQVNYGQNGRIWSVVVDGRSLVWMEEEAGKLQFAVLHHYHHGLWYVAEAFVIFDSSPYAAKVEPVHNRILIIGYPVWID